MVPAEGEMRVARFFDFDHPKDGLNDFVVASGFPVSETRQDKQSPAPAVLDMVLFINGLPLVVVEVKSAGTREGWNRPHCNRYRGTSRQSLTYSTATCCASFIWGKH